MTSLASVAAALALVALVCAAGARPASAEPDRLGAAIDTYLRLARRMGLAPQDAMSAPRQAPPQATRLVARSTAPFGVEIERAARRHGIAPAFLHAVVTVESNYDHLAVSSAGARGLAQIMPATAIELGVHPDDLFDPAVNVEASARYIRYLANRFDGDPDKILIGYNAGPSMVEAGRRPPRETRIYVTRVKAVYRRLNERGRQGILP
jgi:soluble lytic murein transglycosylase-like protein